MSAPPILHTLRHDAGVRVQVGYDPTRGTFLTLVHDDLMVVCHREYELAQDCLDKAAEWLSGRPSSAWLWRLERDRSSPRLPVPESRQTPVTCPECPHVDACRRGAVTCCRHTVGVPA